MHRNSITPERKAEILREKDFCRAVIIHMESGMPQNSAIRRALNERGISYQPARNFAFRTTPNLLKKYGEEIRRKLARERIEAPCRFRLTPAMRLGAYWHERELLANVPESDR